ncbi:HIRAN domain-containing protein [Sphingobium yanoikuyae]|uniref:HIRAN domain-containing protein n=1 Tax=Sphingobium yanoikuyae TaxID=13690 RepID=UPI00345EBA7F
MTLPSMSLAIVGSAHKNSDGSDRRAEIDACMPGEPIDLVLEPDNEFDCHAIAVYSSRAVQIGYVRADRAPRIGSLLGSTEVRAIFQRPAEFGAWVRLAFDGEDPALTDAMLEDQDEGVIRHIAPEPDFYPDEIWPDD